VVFDVAVTPGKSGALLFTTKMSYDVINRTAQEQTWHTKYTYDTQRGKIVEVRFNDAPFDPALRVFHDGLGISIPSILAPGERGKVFLKAEEEWDPDGWTFYTSYNPATDLKIILRENLPGTEFEFEVLYFWKEWPMKRKGYREVYFDKGILPYQGTRLHWRRKQPARKGDLR